MHLRYAIIGDPVAHSLSPAMHNAAFADLGLDASYERIHVGADELQDVWNRRLKTDYAGFNVTLPHKTAVIRLLDEVDGLAASVGAVNTVSNRQDRLVGYNTDVLGIQRTLKPVRNHVAGRPVVILGAGGTARSCVAALASDVLPSRLTFLVRDTSRALEMMALAGHQLSCPVEAAGLADPSASRILSEAALIVQTTPVGMTPDVDDSPLRRPHRFSPHQTVFDVVYHPLETSFLSSARRDGARVIGGLEFFLQQGAAAFEIWTGRTMPLDRVRAAVEQALRP